MSLLPIEVVNVYRNTMDVVVETYGFECSLYIPKVNIIQQREALDVYSEKPDLENMAFEEPIRTNVFVEWKADNKRLRRLGIITEDNVPLIGWFKWMPTLTRNSYIRMDMNYIQGEWGTDEFELVDEVVQNMYNAVIIVGWKLAPRRR